MSVLINTDYRHTSRQLSDQYLKVLLYVFFLFLGLHFLGDIPHIF